MRHDVSRLAVLRPKQDFTKEKIIINIMMIVASSHRARVVFEAGATFFRFATSNHIKLGRVFL